MSEGDEQIRASTATASTVAKAPPPSVYLPPSFLAAVDPYLCVRRRRRTTRTPRPDVPSVPVRRAHDDDDVIEETINTAQRQRVTTGGDYYTWQQERPTWHQRQDNQGCSTYTRLVWQRTTCETQAEWQQHPLWRMCGVCLDLHAAEYWIWNRCCARCAIFLCTVHATELTQPTYIRERQGD
eukprot:2327385-Amphidinium_carterae.1